MEQVIEIAEKMWKDARIVHADFSEFNLLYFQKRVWVIDVSQAVPRDHPLSLRFLLRDCAAVSRFFTSWHIPDVPSAETLFNQITGYAFGNPEESLPNVPTDSALFTEELEAAVLELQRKHNVQRNQFSADLRLGREDDYHEEDAQERDARRT